MRPGSQKTRVFFWKPFGFIYIWKPNGFHFVLQTSMNQARRDVFQAISDPTRREIIHLLARRTLNLNNVADHFTISRPAVAKHIRILTECGLVTVQTRGRETFCQADLKGLKQVSEWANTYQEFWTDKLDALERFLDEDPSDEITKL
jgi:DNA-binding transcriptional ArsR family regulator